MIVDKRLRGVKCVQTLSRLNRTCQGKTDTFILDFVNTAEDIQEAFQPFYNETSLSQEVNVDSIYNTQKELRGYGLYTDSDIEAFCNIYFAGGKQDSKAMGKMTSALLPVADRYNKKTSDDRYKFRRLLRSFIKWYGYISQVTRIFDKELHREYVFCSYLLRLIPNETTVMIDLEGALKLEFYKLEQTFKGGIGLVDGTGAYEPGKAKGAGAPEPKAPLDEVIEKINELFDGDFTDADRVLLYALHDKLKDDQKLRRVAQTSDKQVFAESIFPKTFDEVAQDSYVEQTEAYTSLFQNKNKYKAIMSALAGMLYKEFNRPRV
jgi:type I restriction enzyme R subunit